VHHIPAEVIREMAPIGGVEQDEICPKTGHYPAQPVGPAEHVGGVHRAGGESFLGRPMPPARALVDAGAAVSLATDFNPGSAFCESLPLCCSLAATQLKLAPAEALGACTVNAAHVLGRADRLGRLASGFRADLVLLDAPDWRYLAYHLGGDLVARVVLAGELR
jgi:imidazolonepropionase